MAQKLEVTLPDGASYSMNVTYDPDTQLYVGIVPGVKGAHTQGKTLDEVQTNMVELLLMILDEEDGQ